MREIPPEVAAAQGVPDDLDSSAFDPYSVPSPRRRLQAGAVYLGFAALGALAALGGFGDGFWLAAAALVVIAAYHAVSAWRLPVREGRALETAGAAVGFTVGHASAQVGFVGWRARPVWNVLVFSADDPPAQRGLVRVDGLTGDVVDSYVEDVPAV